MLEIFHLTRKLLPTNTAQSGQGECLASSVNSPGREVSQGSSCTNNIQL